MIFGPALPLLSAAQCSQLTSGCLQLTASLWGLITLSRIYLEFAVLACTECLSVDSYRLVTQLAAIMVSTEP